MQESVFVSVLVSCIRMLPPALCLLALVLALSSAGCQTVRVAPPQIAADTTLSAPPERVYAAAVQAAVLESYAILGSDASGGVLRLQRTQVHRGEYRLAYLTVVVSPAAAGARLMVQTHLTKAPTDSTIAPPVRENGAARARAFLARLSAMLGTP